MLLSLFYKARKVSESKKKIKVTFNLNRSEEGQGNELKKYLTCPALFLYQSFNGKLYKNIILARNFLEFADEDIFENRFLHCMS